MHVLFSFVMLLENKLSFYVCKSNALPVSHILNYAYSSLSINLQLIGLLSDSGHHKYCYTTNRQISSFVSLGKYALFAGSQVVIFLMCLNSSSCFPYWILFFYYISVSNGSLQIFWLRAFSLSSHVQVNNLLFWLSISWL